MADIATNRKASFHYEILETLEAGLVLTGSEVKSLRAGRATIAEGYAVQKGAAFYLIGCHIAPYAYAGYSGHDPLRERKLLLGQQETVRLMGKVQEKGLTLVPLKLYFKGAWAKVLIGVGRGKKHHDKRATIKRRESEREIARAIRSGKR